MKKTFRQALQSDQFVVTAELSLGEGAGARQILHQAEILHGSVAAIQISEKYSQVSTLAASTLIGNIGIDAIPELSGKDRNRIAFMSDLLGLRALGFNTVMLSAGSQSNPEPNRTTPPVWDVSRHELVTLTNEMNEEDSITPGEEFLIGIRDTIPSAKPDQNFAELHQLASAGAGLLQIECCFDLEILKDYVSRLVDARLTWNYAVMASLAPLPSVDTAHQLLEDNPGSIIPDCILNRLESASNPQAEGIAICSELIREIRAIPGIAGVKLLTQDNPMDVIRSIRDSDV